MNFQSTTETIDNHRIQELSKDKNNKILTFEHDEIPAEKKRPWAEILQLIYRLRAAFAAAVELDPHLPDETLREFLCQDSEEFEAFSKSHTKFFEHSTRRYESEALRKKHQESDDFLLYTFNQKEQGLLSEEEAKIQMHKFLAKQYNTGKAPTKEQLKNAQILPLDPSSQNSASSQKPKKKIKIIRR